MATLFRRRVLYTVEVSHPTRRAISGPRKECSVKSRTIVRSTVEGSLEGIGLGFVGVRAESAAEWEALRSFGEVLLGVYLI